MSETRHVPRIGPAAKLLLYAGSGVILALLMLEFATGFYHFLAVEM